jgi:hypothetical protein
VSTEQLQKEVRDTDRALHNAHFRMTAGKAVYAEHLMAVPVVRRSILQLQAPGQLLELHHSGLVLGLGIWGADLDPCNTVCKHTNQR